jgi:hypothetical protein
VLVFKKGGLKNGSENTQRNWWNKIFKYY